MIFADKVIQLRKKNGWSQEELAEKAGVSRQSVSKWEGALSVPELDKILILSSVFGVSTDYLLKDEIEEIESAADECTDTVPSVRRISMEEANSFLRIKALTSSRIALAVFLCILSPLCLLLLAAAADSGMLAVSENIAVAVGMISLFVIAAVAVAVFISCGMKTRRFDYIEQEPIELEYGVDGMVKERMKAFQDSYSTMNIVAACICILSVVPLFLGGLLTENTFVLMLTLALTMIIAGVGVFLFISSGIRMSSMRKLLREGEYTNENKKGNRIIESVNTVYWLLAVSVYLGYSFTSGNWDSSWIIMAVAGVAFAALSVLLSIFLNKK